MINTILWCLLLGPFVAPAFAEPSGHYTSGHRHYSKTIYVRSGHSIQKAVDGAPEGAHIIVKEGTYHEQVLISKDSIRLTGENAVILPPKKPRKNRCTGFEGPGSQAGICVVGDGIHAAKYEVEHKKVMSVRSPVRGVVVSGFIVEGFTGANILVLGAAETTISDNQISDGNIYGILAAGCTDTILFGNNVFSTKGGLAAICVDSFSGTEVIRNTVADNYLGIFIQTNGAVVEYNEVKSACFGLFVDPTIKDAHVCNNKVIGTLPSCGEVGGAGIILDSAVRARVEGNLVQGQKAKNPKKEPRSGIALVDDYCTQKSLSCLLLGKKRAVATGNLIQHNTLSTNQFDLYVNTTGKGNVVRDNSCSTSLPKGYC